MKEKKQVCHTYKTYTIMIQQSQQQQPQQQQQQQQQQDPVFHPFRLSILDRRYGSQINIAQIQLHHIFFQEAAIEFLDMLQIYLISPVLLQQPIEFYEFTESLRTFFAEGATVSMDPNLIYYTPDELVQFMSHFDPAIHFSFFCPHHQTAHQTTVDTVESQNAYLTDLRHLQLM